MVLTDVFITEQCNVTVNSEELIGTTEFLTLYTECRINRCRYNRVRLCFASHPNHSKHIWPCHGSEGQSLAYHLGGLGSTPWSSVADLWWTVCRRNRFISPTSVSCCQYHSTIASYLSICLPLYLYNLSN